MLERHPHRAEHLMHVVDDARGAFLCMQRRERRIARIRRVRGFQCEPAHAAGEDGALGHAMAQRLERAERSPELLALGEMIDRRCHRGVRQSPLASARKRDTQPLANVRRLIAR